MKMKNADVVGGNSSIRAAVCRQSKMHLSLATAPVTSRCWQKLTSIGPSRARYRSAVHLYTDAHKSRISSYAWQNKAFRFFACLPYIFYPFMYIWFVYISIVYVFSIGCRIACRLVKGEQNTRQSLSDRLKSDLVSLTSDAKTTNIGKGAAH